MGHEGNRAAGQPVGKNPAGREHSCRGRLVNLSLRAIRNHECGLAGISVPFEPPHRYRVEHTEIHLEIGLIAGHGIGNTDRR